MHPLRQKLTKCKFVYKGLSITCSKCINFFLGVGRKEFFQEAGEVIDVRFPVLEDGRRKGFGYVEFATVEAAQKVAFVFCF
jgi:hypothetical protein